MLGTHRTVCILVLVFFSALVQAQVRIYRVLPVLQASARYTVEVRQGSGAFQSSPTYQITPNATITETVNDHFSSFGFDPKGGSVEIRVRMKNGMALTQSNASLVNLRYKGVKVSFADGGMTLVTDSVGQHLYVKVQGQAGHPLMIFVDPFADTPIPAGSKVFTFAASSTAYVQNAQYDRYSIPNEVDAVVIEDGALIQGTVHTSSGRTKPLLVTGRGVILGKGAVVHGTTGIPYNALVITKGKKHRVENIMVINSRHFGIDIGDSAVLQNAKMYGYDTNNDGVVGGDGSQILDVFLKVNDDHVKLYNNGMIVRRTNFWGQTNGGILQFGWFGQGGADDILVEDSEVIAYEIGYCGDPALGQGGIARSFFSIQNQDQNQNSRSRNVLIRNIIIQGQLKRLVGLNGNYLNSYPIEFTNTRLENITVLNKPDQQSWIYTRNSTQPYQVSLSFTNVRVGGQCLQNSDFKTEGDVRIQSSCPGNSSSSSAATSSSSQAPVHADIDDLRGLRLPSKVKVFDILGRVLHSSIIHKE
jgi:hypothetical protein